MKRNLKLFLTAIAVYLLLLAALLAAESASPEASITGVWSAVWYSIVTLTTVGYGDLYPVTAAGRVVGALFAISSVGIFAGLISLLVSILNGQLLPRVKLRLLKKRKWYLFSTEDDNSTALASKLLREDAAVIFLRGGDESPKLGGRNVVRTDLSAEQVIQQKPDGAVTCFFISENGRENFTEASELAAKGTQVYCRAGAWADSVPQNLHIFNEEDCLSRYYWKMHPLTKSERKVVLIGCGTSGAWILRRALLTNVFEPGRDTEYHVIGDRAHFRALHYEICDELCRPGTEGDRLVFETGDWTDHIPLLRDADRVIICTDDDFLNQKIRFDLARWVPAKAKIHVRLSESAPGIESFGTRDEILTPEFVLREAIDRLAVWMNTVYNESNPAYATAWRDLSSFTRQSNIAAADHLIVKLRYLLDDDTLIEPTKELCRRAFEIFRERYDRDGPLFEEIEHRRWLRFHRMYNWSYDEKRDNGMRRHPLLVPFDELSEEEQRKDDYAWELLDKLG